MAGVAQSRRAEIRAELGRLIAPLLAVRDPAPGSDRRAFVVGYAGAELFGPGGADTWQIEVFGALTDRRGRQIPAAAVASTPFPIASLTKTFTATLFARQNRHNVNGPPGPPQDYSDLLDRFLVTPSSPAVDQQFRPWRDSVRPALLPFAPGLGHIPVRTLLNYTSSLPFDNKRDSPAAVRQKLMPPDAATMTGYSRKRIDEVLAATIFPMGSPAPPPATTYTYSNLAFAIAGGLLPLLLPEPSVDGIRPTYQTLIRDRIFAPLGMAQSGFLAGADGIDRNAIPTGWNRVDGRFVAQPLWRWLPAYDAAGGIVATPRDLMQWLLYNMGLFEATQGGAANDLTRRQLLGETTGAEQFNVRDPATLSWRIASTGAKDAGDRLGLGWFRRPSRNALPDLVWNNGQLPGFTSYMAFDARDNPDFASSRFGVFVLGNVAFQMVNHVEATAHIANRLLAYLGGRPAPQHVEDFATTEHSNLPD